jgi:phage terminase large subunit-like protein
MRALDLIISGCATTTYAQAVADGRIKACRWVRLACERHLRDLERDDDVWFDPRGAEKFFNYCSYLRHYKGPMRGQRIELDEWQKFVFGCVYGWKRKIGGEQTENWRFHYVYIEVPRKNGKSTIAAACASYDCNMVDDTGAEVYLTATKEEQARIVYNDVLAFVKGSPELADEVEILAGRSQIFAKSSNRTSFIKPLGGNSEKQDGLNPLSVIADEVHEWPDDSLWNVLEDAFGARVNWHMIAITTAGYNKEGICWQERANLLDILEQRVERDDKFGIIYTVDEDKKEEWTDEEQWYIANPALGRGKQYDYMASIAQKAEQTPSKINSFKNKQLNIWTDAAECWLRYDDWKACGTVFDEEILRGKKCKAGMDLARVNDLSAVAYWFPIQEGLTKPHLIVDFYHPEDNLRERQDNDKVPYDLWVDQGHILATPGNTTDFKFILHDILTRARMFRIEEMAYDRHFAGEIVNSLQEEDVNLVEFGMGFVSMGAPTAELERMVIAREFYHQNHPVLNWNASNAVVSRDPAGNIKPDKKLSQKRIDGITATVMAVGRQMANDQDKPKTPYSKRGLRTIGGDDDETETGKDE